MTGRQDDLLTPTDFEVLFAGEPTAPDPTADLNRGRRRRRRHRIGGGVLAAAAAVTVVGVVGAIVPSGIGAVGPVAPPRAVPSPGPSTPAPSRTASGPTTGRDTAPALRRDTRGNLLDADGSRLGGSLQSRDPDLHPFHRTTKNSWMLAVEHLDPARRHLTAYEEVAFTGGGSGEGGLQVGQKLGWRVRGDAGEGMIQLAVTRLAPGTPARLGPRYADADGFCNDLYTDAGACRKTTVDGIDVYFAATSDGGFVMDRLQADGEVGSIIVSPIFGNNTTIALSSMGITRSQAAALLDDPRLDVVG